MKMLPSTTHPLYKTLARHLKCKMPELELPGAEAGKKQFFLCPISSGIDSTAVAVVLTILYPGLPIVYIHTDTGIEIDGTEEAIDRIEQFTGQKVFRLRPAKDLLQIIEDQGNYLPSSRQRFCTQVAKIRPYKNFIKALEAKHPEAVFVSFVGIRADEPGRSGVVWTEGNITSVFPLRQLGLDKTAVNAIVSETVGIPHYYAARTRSGCFTCFFQRRTEIIELIKRSASEMERAAKSECLPAEYAAVLNNLPKSVCSQLGVSRNWLKMAVPAELGSAKMDWSNERGVVKSSKGNQDDLFSTGSKTLFCAVEHHVLPGREADVHFQRFVVYSTTMGGLKTALKQHYFHRLNTRNLFQIDSEQELASRLKLGIYVIEIDDGEQELPSAPEESYTWQSDRQPIALIKKTAYMLEQVLLEEGLKQDAKSGDRFAGELLGKLGHSLGKLLHGSLYVPPTFEELQDDADITEGPIVCNACSR